MAKRYRPVDRDQRFLLAPDMREWLPENHLVWFLLDVVAELDTTALHQRRRRRGQGLATGSAAGRAGYDPDMMLGLLIYAYACGLQSSRRIERLCHTDVAFRVLCAGDIPDHSVIARFRAGHQEVFTELFAQVLQLCARAGLGQVGTVAIDGSKFAANASLTANHQRDWFARAAAERTAAAAETDTAEDRAEQQRLERGEGSGREDGAAADQVPERWSGGDRRARIRACLDELEIICDAADADAASKHEQAQADLAARRGELERLRAEQQDKIDRWHAAWADHRARPTFYLAPQGPCPKPLEQTWRGQRAEHALAQAQARADRADRAADTNDHEQGHEQKGAARRNVTDPDSRLMTSRRGWVQGYNAQFAITADQLVLATQVTQNPNDNPCFIPMTQAAVAAARDIATTARPDEPVDEHGGIGLLLADAGYASEANLTAPGPDRLIALGKTRAQHRAAHDHPTHGEPPAGATARQAMDHRLRTPDGHAAYKRRGATVEPGIGNIKKLLPHLARRGLTAASAEITFAALVHNLRKLYSARAAAA
ncbi:transposase [Actinomycetospora cinnamomea]|uniref:Transposase n=1 Tax=Actinomycetospora cinnamomea TaxID=663609 RepID=A0A2U1E509_9PSEU|nr:transposase [Actinomycetospora cinnamomea]